MLKRFIRRGLKSPIGQLLPIIAVALLLQALFGSSLRTSATEMTYTEFKTALRTGRIQTATVAADQITGKLAVAQTDEDATKAAAPVLYHTVHVDDPDLLKDLEANRVNAAGQAANNGGILSQLGGVVPFILIGVFGYVLLKGMRNAAGGTGASGGIFSFGKSKAHLITGEQTGVTLLKV